MSNGTIDTIFDLDTLAVSPDEFKNYSGIDLGIELKPDDMPGQSQSERFLFRATSLLALFCAYRGHRSIEGVLSHGDFPRGLPENQRREWKMAVCEQAMWMLKNGDIATDSGYTINSAPHATMGELVERVVSPVALMHARLAGALRTNLVHKMQVPFSAVYGYWVW